MTAASTTNTRPKIEIKVTIGDTSYGIDLGALTMGEGKYVEAKSGIRYLDLLVGLRSGLPLAAVGPIAVIAAQRVDPDIDAEQLAREIDDLPILGDGALSVEFVNDEDPVGPTKPKRERTKKSETSGAQN